SRGRFFPPAGKKRTRKPGARVRVHVKPTCRLLSQGRPRSMGAADKDAAEEFRRVGKELVEGSARQAVKDADERPHPGAALRGAGAGAHDDVLPAVVVEVNQADPHASENPAARGG